METEPPAETRQQEEELVWILGFGDAPGMTRWKYPEGSWGRVRDWGTDLEVMEEMGHLAKM